MKYPYLGFGLGLRGAYIPEVLEKRPRVDWFEIISENYLHQGGRSHLVLQAIRENYPIVMHGVSLSIGSSDPLDMNYLKQLKQLADRFEISWLSDHLCWTSVGKTHLHDLLPLPYTEEAIKHVVERVKQAQDFLGRRILLENVSSYVMCKASMMPEWEFYTEVVQQADCLMLLDINNIFVSAHNHHFLPETYLQYMPKNKVQQIHLAGHRKEGDIIIDSHDHPVVDPVWRLYQQAIEKFGPISTMIERDDKLPPLKELLGELEQAKYLAKLEVLA